MIDSLLYLLDMLAVIACSVAATILAYRKSMDLAGTLTIAIFASIGGGTIRDILVDRYPIFWIDDLNYLFVIVIASVIAQLFIHSLERIDKILRTVDAIGIAAYTVIGINVALRYHVSPVIAVMMGAITATFGGIIRDVVCNEIPMIFQKEIYITATLIGGTFYVVFENIIPKSLAATLCLVLVFGIRMTAIRYNWHLPSLWGAASKLK